MKISSVQNYATDRNNLRQSNSNQSFGQFYLTKKFTQDLMASKIPASEFAFIKNLDTKKLSKEVLNRFIENCICNFFDLSFNTGSKFYRRCYTIAMKEFPEQEFGKLFYHDALEDMVENEEVKKLVNKFSGRMRTELKSAFKENGADFDIYLDEFLKSESGWNNCGSIWTRYLKADIPRIGYINKGYAGNTDLSNDKIQAGMKSDIKRIANKPNEHKIKIYDKETSTENWDKFPPIAQEILTVRDNVLNEALEELQEVLPNIVKDIKNNIRQYNSLM